MKTFVNRAAQGELYFVRVDKLPDGLRLIDPENGKVIVGHSETQHHHVKMASRTTMYRLPEEIYEWFLVVEEADELIHLREFDTHEPLRFEPGIYKVRSGREYTPQGWRRSAD